MNIKITIKDISLRAVLNNTKTAKAIFNSLPVEAIPEKWGDEFYFEVPVEMPLDETATTKVKVGDIGYWPPGNALAIFFGPTPISSGEDPVPASDVNIVGKVLDDATILKIIKGIHKIRMEKDG